MSEIEQVAPGVCNVKLVGRRFIKLTGAVRGNVVLIDPRIIMAFVETTLYSSAEDAKNQENGLDATRIMTSLPESSTIDVIETPERIDQIFTELEADNRKDIEAQLAQMQKNMQKQILPAGPLIR